MISDTGTVTVMTETAFADDRQRTLTSLATAAGATHEPLDRLKALRDLIAAARLAEREAVFAARDQRESWAAIGAALQITKQSAARRFTVDPVPQPDGKGLSEVRVEAQPRSREWEVTTPGGRPLFRVHQRAKSTAQRR